MKQIKEFPKERCKHCLELFEFEDILEHEDKCSDNMANVDEGSSIECGDW